MVTEINELIVRCVDPSELFAGVCRIAVKGGFDRAWVALLANERLTDWTAAWVRGGTHSVRNDLHVDDVALNAPWWADARAGGARSVGAFPLRCEGDVVGALNVSAARSGALSDVAIATLSEMALLVSCALTHLARAEALRNAAQVIEASPVVLFRWRAEPDWPVEYVSANVRQWGTSRAELSEARAPYGRLVLDDDLARVGASLDTRALAQGEPVVQEYRLRTAAGEVRWVEDRTSALCDAEGRLSGYAGWITDITERVHARQALVESEGRFRGLVEQAVTGIFIIQDGKLAYANPRCASIFGFDGSAEMVGCDPVTLTLPEHAANNVEQRRRLLAREVPSVAYEFIGVRRDGTHVEVGAHGALASLAGRPAIVGMLQDIGEKKRAAAEITRYVAALEDAFQSAVDVVTTLSEMRDPYTAGHSRRVGEIAAAIAGEYGFDAHRVEGLRVAGHLHDIGKFMIPAEILAKPGKLTTIEYAMIKEHAQAGYEVLKKMELPWPVAEVARQHHERIDGTGYPRGLRGDGIVLEARILAVADVVEAMGSHRPYRAALGIEKALAEIERGSGTAYDADVADCALRLFRKQGYELPS